uniref:C-type lectin domain-containing protein n=1 Tax=Branchiostoma floridae TaxID=7739 RepID=C3ZFH3_BRAFL|eukprot:XP_002592716.1 hypothetical protein BRAFLDRAFT_67156 [Branchiostoma floridae]
METCVQFVRGPQGWGWFYPRKFATTLNYSLTGDDTGRKTFRDVPDIDGDRDKYDILTWDVQPGNCIVFHMKALHGAPADPSLSLRRRVVSTRWVGDDAVLAERPWEVSPPITGEFGKSPHQLQGGFRGRVRQGNGAFDKWQGDQESSTDTYEEAEAVKRYATYTSADRTYPGGASGRNEASSRRSLCSFIRSHQSLMAAGIAVLLSLIAVGFAPLTFMNKEEIIQLSTTVDDLKRNQDDMSTTIDDLMRNQDDMSTTVDALMRDQDDMPTTLDDLKRNQDDMSATVDALKSNQNDMSTTVDALKRDQDDLSTTVDALKRDQDDMFTTVEAFMRNQDEISTTFDYLKSNQEDMSTTVEASKRDQDDMSTTVDTLKCNQNDMSTTVDASKHEISMTLLSCPEGYAEFRGICYKAFKSLKSFRDAAVACGKDGGTLAMPGDAETNAFLISLYRSVSNQAFWFGLHDQREEGSFEWVDGSALGTYSSWAPTQPDNVWGSEDCVLYESFWYDKWYDSRCNWEFYFICQAVPENRTLLDFQGGAPLGKGMFLPQLGDAPPEMVWLSGIGDVPPTPPPARGIGR